MKRCALIFISLILVLCFSSCAINFDKPDTVTIEKKEYIRAFIGELYPVDASFPNTDGVKVSGNFYYQYSGTPFDCYITYDRNAEPNIYFEKEQFEEAASHYKNADSFKFFCLLGNIHDENDQQIIDLENIDYSMFNSLFEFSKDNDYNPFTSFNNEDGVKKVPIADPDDWIADEIHFYKESKDGFFTTSKAYTFILYENKLCFLYQYDFSDGKDPVMIVRDIPSEISDYFCSLLNQMQIIDKTG